MLDAFEATEGAGLVPLEDLDRPEEDDDIIIEKVYSFLLQYFFPLVLLKYLLHEPIIYYLQI